MIAIIAILAAMLLPALNKAREKAITITCLNNLKQFGLAQTMYANEHNQYIASAYIHLTDYDGETSCYYGYDVSGRANLIRGGYFGSKDETTVRTKYFQCPADSDKFDIDGSKTGGTKVDSYHYIMFTPGIIKEKSYFGGDTTYARHRLDGNCNPGGAIACDRGFCSSSSLNEPFHGNITNVVYLDGHAKQLDNTKMIISATDLRDAIANYNLDDR